MSKKENKIYLIVWSVCKYRMQIYKVLSSQLLQSLSDVLSTHNTMRLKILETGRTHAVMSACGVNDKLCCAPSIMIDSIQVIRSCQNVLLPRWIPTIFVRWLHTDKVIVICNSFNWFTDCNVDRLNNHVQNKISLFL